MEFVHQLEVIALRKECEVLKAEMHLLKTCIANDAYEACKSKAMKTISREDREKWEFYHKHKCFAIEILSNETGVNSTFFAWHIVKHKTDEMYLQYRSSHACT